MVSYFNNPEISLNEKFKKSIVVRLNDLPAEQRMQAYRDMYDGLLRPVTGTEFFFISVFRALKRGQYKRAFNIAKGPIHFIERCNVGLDRGVFARRPVLSYKI